MIWQIFVPSRGAIQVVEELDKILAFNHLLISLNNHPESRHFARGVGPALLLGIVPVTSFRSYQAFMVFHPTLVLWDGNLCKCGLGGEYDGDRKIDDLKLLYRAYVTDSLSTGRMEETKVHMLWL